MYKLLVRVLTTFVNRLGSAPPESRTGRFVARLKETVEEDLLAEENLVAFEDTTEQESMLADEVRVDRYAAAIARHVNSDDVVVDLGAGTGILSFLAAREAKKVYAVEHSGIIDKARSVGEANGFTNIEFVHCNSRDFTTPEPVDVILHEQIGDELLDENMIRNVVDLRTRLLQPGGRIVPALFELYAEPVAVVDEYRTPFIWQMNLHGIDYGCLAAGEKAEIGLRDQDTKWLHRREFDHLLCEPEPVYHLDLMTVAEDHLPTSFKASKTVTNPGMIDGIIIYLRIIFDEDNDLNTSPAVLTRSSWGNRFFRLPPRFLDVGQSIDFSIDAPDVRDFYSWSLSVTQPDLLSVDSPS